MSLGSKIKERRLQLNLTLEELGKKAGVSKPTIQRYESGVISNIPSDRIELIAKALDVTPAYLMGWEENPIDINSIPGVIPITKLKKIPILGTIACGDPILAVENYDGYFVADPKIVTGDFALNCKGDSMIDANIYDGDIVFFKSTPTVDNGRIAAVIIDGEATLKKFYKKTGMIILQPCNSAFEPIIISEKDLKQIQVVGEMVGVYSRR